MAPQVGVEEEQRLMFLQNKVLQCFRVYCTSDRAINVNIAIMRAFVRMRELLLNNAKMAAKLREIEDRIDTQEMNTIIIMDKLKTLTKTPQKTVKKIGFNTKK